MQFAVAIDNGHLVCWINFVTVQKRAFEVCAKKIEPNQADRPYFVCIIEFETKQKRRNELKRKQERNLLPRFRFE